VNYAKGKELDDYTDFSVPPKMKKISARGLKQNPVLTTT
jgi:hypothetical protein